MKSKFRGYYHIHKEDLLDNFDNCLFVFDASALLDIFRLSKALTDQVLNVINHYADKIKVPYHAAEEYNAHINDVLEDQYKKIEEAKKNFQCFEHSINAKRNQPYISEKATRLMQRLKSQIEKDFDSQSQYIMDELIYGNLQNRISNLLDQKVLEPFPQDKIKELEEEGAKRYEAKVPPGFKDASKHSNQYGDYINWREILELAKDSKKSIIFISNDLKNDWIEEVRGKKLGPHHTLSQEFYRTTGEREGQLFYIYTLDAFLEFIQDHDQTDQLPEGMIESVKNILEESVKSDHGLDSKMEEDIEQFESGSDYKSKIALPEIDVEKPKKIDTIFDSKQYSN